MFLSYLPEASELLLRFSRQELGQKVTSRRWELYRRIKNRIHERRAVRRFHATELLGVPVEFVVSCSRAAADNNKILQSTVIPLSTW